MSANSLLRTISLLTLCLCLHTGRAQQTLDYKYAQDVFNRLVRVINLSSPAKPLLEVIPDPSKIAETTPEGKIIIGYGLIERCRSFGKDSANALAHVLSHELTHYYSGHFWSDRFGSAYADISWGKTISNTGDSPEVMQQYETQADEYGMYYAFAAGFRTLDVGDRVLDSIYHWYQLQEKLPGYPSLVERKLIAGAARKNILALIPVFEDANLCLTLAQTLSGEQQAMLAQAAAYQYDDILAQKIQTKEMYNNAAVARMLSIVYLLPDSLQSIQFPCMLETGSMLYRAEKSRTQNGGPDSVQQVLITERLEDAMELLTAAIKADKQFYPAYINKAIAAWLLGNYGTAGDALQTASRIMGESHPLIWAVYEMRGILEFTQWQQLDPELFAMASGKGSASAAYNLALLDKKTDPVKLAEMQKPAVANATDTEELFDGISVFDYMDKLAANRTGRMDLQNGQLIIYSDTIALATIFYVRANYKPSFAKLRFLVVDDANASTSKNLRRGDNLSLLEKKYGKPAHILLESRAVVYHYPAQNLFVWMEDGKVTKWAYWWMK